MCVVGSHGVDGIIDGEGEMPISRDEMRSRTNK